MITLNEVEALNAIANEVHRLAVEKHWHDEDFHDDKAFIARAVANLHGEASEFWEAYRNGNLNNKCDKPCCLTCAEEEMADIVIRAMDMASRLGIDLGQAIAVKHEYNTTRPARHGGKLA